MEIETMKSVALDLRKKGGFLILVMLLWSILSSEDAAAQLPDLAVDFRGPSTAFAGEDISKKIEITVRNLGGTEARGFYVDIILTEPTGTEHVCARERIENMPAKRSVRLLFGTKHPVLIPGGIEPGRYRLCAFADPTDAVRESREKNNKVCHVITVTSNDF